MSPSDAPESDEPYCATACFSSAICIALIEKLGFFERSKPTTIASNFWPDLEALGALLVAVAAKVAALDEAGRAVVADLDVEPGVLDRADGDGHDIALVDRPTRRGPSARWLRSGTAPRHLPAPPPSSCFMPSEMRSFSTSTSSTCALTVSPLR